MPRRRTARFFVRLACGDGLGSVGRAGGIAGVGGATRRQFPLTRAPYLSDLTQTSVQVSWAAIGQTTGVVEYGQPGNCTAHSVIATKMGNPITINGVTEYPNSVLVT